MNLTDRISDEHRALLSCPEGYWGWTSTWISEHPDVRWCDLPATITARMMEQSVELTRDLIAAGVGQKARRKVLWSTAGSGDTQIAGLMLASGVTSDPVAWPTALLDAAYAGHEEIIKLLLADSVGRTASDQCDYDICGERLQVDIGGTPAGTRNNALARAVKRGHTEVVRVLVTDGIPRAVREDMLLRAVWKDQEEIVQILATSGVSSEALSFALWRARERGFQGVVRVLEASR